MALDVCVCVWGGGSQGRGVKSPPPKKSFRERVCLYVAHGEGYKFCLQGEGGNSDPCEGGSNPSPPPCLCVNDVFKFTPRPVSGGQRREGALYISYTYHVRSVYAYLTILYHHPASAIHGHSTVYSTLPGVYTRRTTCPVYLYI